ncbi:MAG: DUF1289 domain-containing protein [Pseudomonadota bacterium]
MNAVSPCTGICKLDDETGWCVGCARTGDEIFGWSDMAAGVHERVWGELPSRFAQLGVSCRRLPWTTEDIRRFVVERLEAASGTWVVGVVGAVAEFAAKPKQSVAVDANVAEITAITDGGALRFKIDDDVRALTFDPPDTPPEQQRIVLAVKREWGFLPVAKTITDLGADNSAITQTAFNGHLFDFGLGRKEARFLVRCTTPLAQNAMANALGEQLSHAFGNVGPVLVAESPTRVVESALGRIEVSTPIPPPGGKSPAGSHTHLLPNHLATKRALPTGMDLPRAYWPGAIFYPVV